MPVNPWKAPSEVVALLNSVKDDHHADRLANASLAVSFEDTKPFVKNKLNLGRITKFSPLARLWQGQQHDFCLSIPADLWHQILKGDEQRRAYLDLQLTRCSVEYKPEEVVENGKKKVIKDEWGRVRYTTEPKTDEEGNPKWKILPLDLDVFADNVSRFGLWSEELVQLETAMTAAQTKGGGDADQAGS